MPVAPDNKDTSFLVSTRLDVAGNQRGRTGILTTPHGSIATPAFIPVGTKATVKAMTPEQITETGSQAVLANAYHLYLQPGPEILDAAGGLGKFMNWTGPTFTDSGGFQVMSLGAGFKKVIDMTGGQAPDDKATAKGKERLAKVDEDGVTFKSHRDGSKHRFTAEISMQIQHQLGADIMFAFDELTTLMNTREYQERSVERTHRWADRCLSEHQRLTRERTHRPLQSLWGVIQGAQYEDLRRQATRGLVSLSEQAQSEGRRGFGGYGIGGALEKDNLGTIVGWCVDELPESAPRHLLGISEPDDIFAAVENGADTFDCVAPTRLARHGYLLTRSGKLRINNARFKTDQSVIDAESPLATSRTYSRAYLHHLFKADEHLANTIASMHNVNFLNQMMLDIRTAIDDGSYVSFKSDFLGRYYGTTPQGS